MPPPLAGEQALWVEVLDYVWYAERWHWTPDQVDDLPVKVAVRMREVAMLIDEVRAERRG